MRMCPRKTSGTTGMTTVAQKLSSLEDIYNLDAFYKNCVCSEMITPVEAIFHTSESQTFTMGTSCIACMILSWKM